MRSCSSAVIRRQIEHNQVRKIPLVCHKCKEDGYTEKDVGTHQCKACRERKPRGKFDRNLLNNALKSADRILVCLSCANREAAVVAKLSGKTGSKKAYLCSCRCPIHTEKCAVYRAWPGHNVGVTVDDLRFLKFRPGNVKRYNL